MRKKTFFRIASGVVTLAFAISLAAPAGAFYIGLPQSVKKNFTKLKALAQEGQMMQQQPMDQGTLGQFQPMPSQTGPAMGQPGQFDQGQNQQFNFQDQGQFGPNQMGPEQNQMGPNQPGQFQDQGQYGSNQMGPNDQGQFDQQRQQQDQQRMEQDQQRQQQDQKRQLQDMKRNLKPMENNLKQFERQLKASEKRGQKLTPEMEQKLQAVKTKMEAIKNADSAEELQDFDMGELGNEMQELEQTRREAEESQRRVQDLQRHMKGAQQGLTQFERQINQLTKKKIAIPQELKEAIQKIKTIFAVVKKAKTWEEMEAAGVEDLQDLMMSLDEYRQQLEMLTRWPQTEKQLNQEIKNLDREYKRSQTLVKNLAKKGIDLSGELAAFKEAVDRIKAVRADAAAKIKSGASEDIQAAFDTLESDFYGQMEDVWQYQRIIQTMSNLGRFQSDFKRRTAEAQRMITQLKRQKIDTTDLTEALSEIKAQGNEILAMLKVKPIDEEAVMDALQELEGLGGQFEEMISELRGGEGEEMPWEKGPQQFKSPIESFSAMQKLIPQKPKEEPAQASASGPTCNIDGVEVPGTCESLGVAE